MTKRAAFLVGTAQYAHLPAVPAAANSLERMRMLLTGQLCGWLADQVTVLADERAPGSIPDRMVETFSEVQDVALFYFVGHGLPDDDDRLCLGLVDTRIDAIRRYTTSLPFDAVREAMRYSRARFKVVILDCCYAGLALSAAGHLGPDDERDIHGRLSGTGAFVLAACGPYGSAWYENESVNPEPCTHFTKRLASVVESGINMRDVADDDDERPRVLTLGRLTHLLTEELAADGKPKPTRIWRDQAAELAFATYPRRADTLTRDGAAALPLDTVSTQCRWGTDLPDPVLHEPAGMMLASDAAKGQVYPDVPAAVWEISDVGERARALLEHGFRLAETDVAQARRVFASAELMLHADVAFPFTRYRLLVRAAQETRFSMPGQARRFLGLAVSCAAANERDALFSAARDELRQLHAVIPDSSAGAAG